MSCKIAWETIDLTAITLFICAISLDVRVWFSDVPKAWRSCDLRLTLLTERDRGTNRQTVIDRSVVLSLSPKWMARRASCVLWPFPSPRRVWVSKPAGWSLFLLFWALLCSLVLFFSSRVFPTYCSYSLPPPPQSGWLCLGQKPRSFSLSLTNRYCPEVHCFQKPWSRFINCENNRWLNAHQWAPVDKTLPSVGWGGGGDPLVFHMLICIIAGLARPFSNGRRNQGAHSSAGKATAIARSCTVCFSTIYYAVAILMIGVQVL